MIHIDCDKYLKGKYSFGQKEKILQYANAEVGPVLDRFNDGGLTDMHVASPPCSATVAPSAHILFTVLLTQDYNAALTSL